MIATHGLGIAANGSVTLYGYGQGHTIIDRYKEVLHIKLVMNIIVGVKQALNMLVGAELILNRAVESTQVANLSLTQNSVMNRLVTNEYSELEKQ